MKNILVTGGLGFIGSHTAVELINSGYNPVIIDNLSNSNESVINGIQDITGTEITFIQGDYQDSDLLENILKDHSIDGVIHFAAHKAVAESIDEPLKYYSNNVAGLVNLLPLLNNHNVANFVFSSSCTVYGEPDSVPITEEAPFKPAESPYGATKQMGESILKDAAKVTPIKIVALRYFNPVGAHPSGKIGELPKGIPANLIPYVTQAAAGIRNEITIHGSDYPTPDGTCIRDYIHVVDLAKAHIKALEFAKNQPIKSYEVINIGTGVGSSVLEVINTFEKVNDLTVPHKFGPRRNGDIISTYADPSKAKDKLNWQSEKTLSDALKDAWNWQKNLG